VGYTDIQRFLDRLDDFKTKIDRNALNGNPAAVEAIERWLPREQRRSTTAALASA
jgi:hypothetical protein